MKTQSMTPGQPGYVPRNGNEAQRQRENAAIASPAPGAHRTVISNADTYIKGSEAQTVCYRAGLPESAKAFVQRVLQLESQVFLLEADVRSLSARLARLENKS